MTVRDSGGNVFIDYVWGNVPMQPNDDRGEYTLNPELDNHIIAVSGYQGFPEFAQGFPYNDTIINKTVPDVVGMFSATAKTTLNVNGLNWSETTTTSGATSLNDGKIKSQNPASGTVVNDGDNVDIVKYYYIAPGPATTGPIAGFNRNGGIVGGLNGNQAVMYLVGRTVRPTIGDYITVSGSSNASHNVIWLVSGIFNDDSYNTGGTAVKVTINSGTTDSDTSSGGTWTVVPPSIINFGNPPAGSTAKSISVSIASDGVHNIMVNLEPLPEWATAANLQLTNLDYAPNEYNGGTITGASFTGGLAGFNGVTATITSSMFVSNMGSMARFSFNVPEGSVTPGTYSDVSIGRFTVTHP